MTKQVKFVTAKVALTTLEASVFQLGTQWEKSSTEANKTKFVAVSKNLLEALVKAREENKISLDIIGIFEFEGELIRDLPEKAKAVFLSVRKEYLETNSEKVNSLFKVNEGVVEMTKKQIEVNGEMNEQQVVQVVEEIQQQLTTEGVAQVVTSDGGEMKLSANEDGSINLSVTDSEGKETIFSRVANSIDNLKDKVLAFLLSIWKKLKMVVATNYAIISGKDVEVVSAT